MWQINLQMFKMVPSTGGQELETWAPFLHSCQPWLLTQFLESFLLSVKGKLFVYGFLRDTCCSSWTHSPTQTQAVEAAVTHPLYSLCLFSFILRICRELVYLTFCEVRAEERWRFLWDEVTPFRVKSGDRRGGRQEWDLNSLGPLIFPYRGQSISHGA